MKRHPLWRRLPAWLKRRPSYKNNHALHAYEDRVLLALIVERGEARYVYNSPRTAATEWWWRERDRWDRTLLARAFKRMAREGDLRMAAQGNYQKVA